MTRQEKYADFKYRLHNSRLYEYLAKEYGMYKYEVWCGHGEICIGFNIWNNKDRFWFYDSLRKDVKINKFLKLYRKDVNTEKWFKHIKLRIKIKEFESFMNYWRVIRP